MQRSNTLLTILLVLGFGLLMLSSLEKLAATSLALPAADWSSLLPSFGNTTWPLPIFFNLLCRSFTPTREKQRGYGQAVPLLVERMKEPASVREAIFLGSLVPLLLGISARCHISPDLLKLIESNICT